MHRSVKRTDLPATRSTESAEPTTEYFRAQFGVNESAPGGTRAEERRRLLAHSAEVLSADRRKTSLEAREQALKAFLEAAVRAYPDEVPFSVMDAASRAAESPRSKAECTAALQLVCALLYSDHRDCADFDSIVERAQLVAVNLSHKLSREVDNELAAVNVNAYATLAFFLNAGGGGYNAEKLVVQLLELAEKSEGDVCCASLSGAALLLTLASEKTALEIASQWLYSFVPLLSAKHAPTRIAAAKLLAVLIEECDAKGLQEDQDCVDAIEDIRQELQSQTHDTHNARRERKTQNMLFKNVLRLLDARLSSTELDEEEKSLDELVADSSFLKHSVSKSLGVHSWGTLALLEHLLFVFGHSLGFQLAHNKDLRELFTRAEVEDLDFAAAQPESAEELPSATSGASTSRSTPKSAVQREREIRKEKLRKAEEQGLTM